MDLKRNLQVNQPNVTELPEGNGWPEPLGENSNPLRMKVTNGRNGESSMGPKIATSQQGRGEHHTPETEGSSGNTSGAGALSGPLSTPETYNGGASDGGFVGSDRGDYSTSIPKTSQQKRGDHSCPEGE